MPRCRSPPHFFGTQKPNPRPLKRQGGRRRPLEMTEVVENRQDQETAQDQEAQGQEKTSKKKRAPSMRYPAYPLDRALNYARILHDQETRSPIQTDQISSHFGLSGKNSQVRAICAALVQYGLAEYPRRKEIAVTHIASTILSFPDDCQVQLKQVALKPDVHKRIWERFGDTLPSEGNIAVYLHGNCGFSEKLSRYVARNYRSTLQFAGLGSGVGPVPVPEKSSDEPPPEPTKTEEDQMPDNGGNFDTPGNLDDFHNIELQLEEGPALIRIPHRCSPTSQRILVRTIEAITGYEAEKNQ